MNVKPAPILLTFEMPKGLYVNTFRSTATSDIDAYEQSRTHKLPFGIARNTDWKPAKMYILTEEPLCNTYQGWSLEGTWEWDDAPIRAKSRLFQTLTKNQLKSQKKKQLGNSWIIEGPDEVKSPDGRSSSVWICADFQYVDIEGKDGFSIDISRKVQATQSIWEEMGDGIYGLNEEGHEVRVKVRTTDDESKFLGRKLVKITDMNLNVRAWEGVDHTVADHWNQDKERYSKEDAEQIPVVLVSLYKGGDPSRYPADQVYRVMSMENWPKEVRAHLSNHLNLTATNYLRLVKRSMRWFGGWQINKQPVSVDYGWDGEFDVQYSDSRRLLKLPNGSDFLWNNWRWFSNVKSFESLHERPPPSVNVYFVLQPGKESLGHSLKKHAEQTFAQIPFWDERVFYNELETIPDDTRAKADLFIEDMIERIQSNQRSVVVYSALPPKSEKPRVNLYKALKYALDESGIIHQNFALNSNDSLKKNPDSASGKVNVLQMLLKMGFLPVPYSCDVGDVDVVCAIDVGRIGPNESVTAFAVSITKSGQLWGTTPKGEPQTGETISEDAIRRTIKGIVAKHKKVNSCLPRRILMMRDGNTPRKELKRIQQIVSEYRELGVDICWVSVRKSGAPRLLNFEGNKVVDQLPTKGHWLQYGERSAWMWTTGSPELKEGRPGIPQGSGFTLEVNFQNNPLSVEQTAQLLIAHAHASQMQPWNSTRLPFVHHLADKMAKAMANGEIPLDQNGERFSAA